METKKRQITLEIVMALLGDILKRSVLIQSYRKTTFCEMKEIEKNG